MIFAHLLLPARNFSAAKDVQASSFQSGFSRGRNILNSAPASLESTSLIHRRSLYSLPPCESYLNSRVDLLIDWEMRSSPSASTIVGQPATDATRDVRLSHSAFRGRCGWHARCYVMAANGGNITRGKVFSSHGDQLSPPASTITPARFRMGQRCEVEVAEV